jgi:uncharacterized protein DUF6644
VLQVNLKNSWLFPALESIHVAGIALLVGTIVLLDLRILHWGLRGCTIDEVGDCIRPWVRTGLAVMLITGSILFLGDADRYFRNPAFLAKMALLSVALTFQFAMRRGRLAAVISLVLWTGVVLAGRAIADFDVF